MRNETAGEREPAPREVLVTVLGVGNLLLGDDGVGPHVAQDLSEDPSQLPGGTRVLDGGTFGLDLAPYLYGVERLVIVDAVHHGSQPGHVGVWRGHEIPGAFSHPTSVHHVGVDALLGALALCEALPGEVTVVGVEPASLEPGIGLSGTVTASLPRLRSAVVAAAHGDPTPAVKRRAEGCTSCPSRTRW